MGRIRHISILQAFGIVLVVIGHSFPPEGFMSVPDWAMILEKVIYSFHMPLFVFASGFLFTKTNKNEDYFKFIRNKAERLLIPYVIFIVTSTSLKGALSKFAVNPIDLSFSLLVQHILYPWSAILVQYWFLVTLFCIFLFRPIFEKVYRMKSKVILLLSFILILLNIFNPLSAVKLLSIHRLFDLLIFFWFGCVAARYHIIIDRYFSNVLLMIISTALLVSGNLIFETTPLVSLIKALAGIVMSWSFCTFYVRFNWTIFNFIEGKSFTIYLLHGIVNLCVGSVFKVLGLGFMYYFTVLIFSGILIPLLSIKALIYFKINNTPIKILTGI